MTATVATGQSAWGSILTPSTGSITIPYGDSTEVEAKAATNYEFVKWSDPQGLLLPADTINAKVKVRNTAKSGTLTAVFKHSPVAVTIIASPSNGGSVSPNGLQYLDYQTGTLTVIRARTGLWGLRDSNVPFLPGTFGAH